LKRLRTIATAKKEIHELQTYVNLVENYETNTLEQSIFKSYAYTNSLQKVVETINKDLEIIGEPLIDQDYVTLLIKSKPQDELHKVLRSNYLLKTRHTRKKPY